VVHSGNGSSWRRNRRVALFAVSHPGFGPQAGYRSSCLKANNLESDFRFQYGIKVMTSYDKDNLERFDFAIAMIAFVLYVAERCLVFAFL
jgi:hypothetical protein